MKQLYLFLLALLLTPVMAAAQDAESVEINETNFPDAKFRDYLTKWVAYESPGVLTEKKLRTTSMDITNKGIKSLKGIEFFTNLDSLVCGMNQLESIDLSGNTRLQFLDVSKNKLQTLDLEPCADLRYLKCSGNQFETIDLSHSKALRRLDCSSNKLVSLSLAANDALDSLACFSNKLTSLDLSKNAGLRYLICNNNQIASFDLSVCPKLYTLICHDNKVEALDISHNPELYELECYSMGLTSLDISKNGKLGKLTCSFNNLTSLDTHRNPLLTKLLVGFNKQLSSLDVSGNPGLLDLELQSCPIEKLDISGCHQLKQLSAQFAKLTSIDISGNPELTDLNCSGNQLVAVDLSGFKSYTGYVSNNSRTVDVVDDNKLDLTTLAPYGFDVSRASKWTGGTLEGNILTFTADKVTYYYDTKCQKNANLRNVKFTLVRNIVSGIGPVANDGTSPFKVSGRVLTLAGNTKTIEVYKPDGQTVCAGAHSVIELPCAGIYIVNVDGKAYKVAVD